ncbi:MAG: CDP-alcohol phosphatidyltransferase family protein [Deltaproteobacteria bacterium]|nr:CDP-alcohol phosphatidyltransferase family protein [Deltaproteobacteria bacterium]
MARFTVPNILCFVRIFLCPFFVVAAARGFWKEAFILFCIAAVTDMVDGSIARIFKQKSNLGAFLDPMADKILMASAFITLAILRLIPFWLALVVFLRDLMIVIGLIIFKAKRIKLVYKPTFLSKMATFFQIFALVFALAPRGLSFLENNSTEHLGFFIKGFPVMLGGAFFFTLVTGLQYYQIGLRILRTGSYEN